MFKQLDGPKGRMVALTALVAMFAVLAAACGGGGGQATTPTPADGASPTPADGTGGPDASDPEWEQVLAAGRQEGQVVVVMGGAASRNFAPLFEDFRAETGIEVVAATGRGSEQVEKLTAERAAGLYSSDIWMTGVTSTLAAIRAGIVGEFRPDEMLVVPEVADPSNWYEGRHWFADADTRNTVYAFCASPNPQFAVNTDLVDPASITSYWDLVDGRFRGKMVGTIPWEPGQTNSEFYINHPDLGEAFIRELILNQDVEWVADGQQAVDLLAAGAKEVFVYQGNASADIDDLGDRGLPVVNLTGATLREGGAIGVGGTCAMGLIDTPKNPNATKVFVNWWLGRDNMYKAQGITDDQSLRADVPTDNMRQIYVRDTSTQWLFFEMDDNIVQNAGLEFNRRIASEAGLR